MKVLILGVNGFIGNALTRTILAKTDWEIFGMDLAHTKLGHSLDHPRFHFVEGDISIHREWVEYHVKKCDVVLPLVAIATPALYVKDPLRVFELDFEENLTIIRLCWKYGKRVVFPSTSEVYGMCPDGEFSEDTSTMVYGPVNKSRWIYACSKQLLDRVLAAYGQQKGLRFTCFRPFNWIGPKLDDINAAKEGSSRVVTQFVVSLIEGQPVYLVDGGRQRRCYTWLYDGIDGLMRIIEDRDNQCNGQIFNLGNPDNECSVRELAERLADCYRRACSGLPNFVEPELLDVEAQEFYGAGYEDMVTRKPAIDKAREVLGWNPEVDLETALDKTFQAFLEDSQQAQETGADATHVADASVP